MRVVAVGLTRYIGWRARALAIAQAYPALVPRALAAWLSRTIPPNDAILANVSLGIESPAFVAILGPSGAGKSTLLRALSGINPPAKGAVWLDGDHNFYQDPGPFRGLIGYVPQENIVHPTLTVWRALDYAARLRLAPNLSSEDRADRIADVLEKLGLTDQERKTIGKLSGGQMKRVNVALELLVRPSVLFLDEPTSGLDPGLDKSIMDTLKALAAEGRVVVIATHATDNLAACDLVGFIAPGGRLVYYGPQADILSFFQVASYPDVYQKVATDIKAQDVQAVERVFLDSPYCRKHVEEPCLQHAKSTSVVPLPAAATARQISVAAVRQWSILTRRYLEVVLRDGPNALFLLGQTLVVAALLSMVTAGDYYTPGNAGNTEQLLLIFTMTGLLLGTVNAAREIAKEQAIYRRERMVCLHIWPYILSKMGVLGGLAAVQMLMLLYLSALKTPSLPAHGLIGPASVEMYITLLLTAFTGTASGLFISSLFSSPDRALTCAIVVPIAEIVFSGAVFTLSGVASGVALLFPSRWCMAALGSIVKLDDLLAQAGVPTRVLYSGADAPHLLGYWAILLIFICALLTATALVLRRLDV